MTEEDPSTRNPRRDRLMSFLRMQELMGYPIVLGPGVREPLIGPAEHTIEKEGLDTGFISVVRHEDGTYSVIVDPE